MATEENKETIQNSNDISTSSVHIECKINNVYDIDVINGTFSVRMHLYLTHDLNEKDAYQYKKNINTFEPDIDFEILNVQKYHHFERINIEYKSKEINGEISYLCRCKYELIMICAQQFHLESFPFDSQDLSIYIKLNKSIDHSKDIACFSVDKSNICFEDYDLIGVITEFNECSVFIFRMKLKRNAFFFIAQYFAMVFALSLVAFTVFYIDNDSMPDRLSVLITLMLTFVAERFVISCTSPNVPYFTLMDKYLSFNFCFLVIFTIFCIIYNGNDDDEMFTILGFVYLFFYFAFIAYCAFKKKRENAKLTMTTKELQQYFGINSFDATLKVDKEDTNKNENEKIFRSAITM